MLHITKYSTVILLFLISPLNKVYVSAEQVSEEVYDIQLVESVNETKRVSEEAEATFRKSNYYKSFTKKDARSIQNSRYYTLLQQRHVSSNTDFYDGFFPYIGLDSDDYYLSSLIELIDQDDPEAGINREQVRQLYSALQKILNASVIGDIEQFTELLSSTDFQSIAPILMEFYEVIALIADELYPKKDLLAALLRKLAPCVAVGDSRSSYGSVDRIVADSGKLYDLYKEIIPLWLNSNTCSWITDEVRELALTDEFFADVVVEPQTNRALSYALNTLADLLERDDLLSLNELSELDSSEEVEEYFQSIISYVVNKYIDEYNKDRFSKTLDHTSDLVIMRLRVEFAIASRKIIEDKVTN